MGTGNVEVNVGYVENTLGNIVSVVSKRGMVFRSSMMGNPLKYMQG